jgi:hypothetical protein
LPGTAIWRQIVTFLPTEKEYLASGRNLPAIEGRRSGPILTSTTKRHLSWLSDDERGSSIPQPEIWDATEPTSFRKLHQRVAAFANIKGELFESREEEWLAAKMMGRWRSGALWRCARCTTMLSLEQTYNATTLSSLKKTILSVTRLRADRISAV